MKKGLYNLIPVLKVTKEVSSACPHLKSSVGVLLVVLDVYEVRQDPLSTCLPVITKGLTEILGRNRSHWHPPLTYPVIERATGKI